jgi:hypothetical protein
MMSFQLMAWAVEQTTGSATRKAVLLALANRANHDTGECYPSIARLARETEMHPRTVQRALNDLIDGGWIARETRTRENGSDTSSNYRFPHVTPADDTAPPPPGTAPPSPRQTATLPPAQRHPQNLEVNQEGVNPRTPTLTGPVKVAGRKVSDAERTLADEVLAEWNRQTGQSLRAPDWKSKIILRHREKPHLTAADHAVVIGVALADPWWQGPATPSVVYGNAAQFERTLEHVRASMRSAADVAAEAIRRMRDEQEGQVIDMEARRP